MRKNSMFCVRCSPAKMLAKMLKIILPSMLEVPGRFLASLGALWELLGSILEVLDSILDLPGTDFGGFGLASSCLAVKFQAPGNDVTIEY